MGDGWSASSGGDLLCSLLKVLFLETLHDGFLWPLLKVGLN